MRTFAVESRRYAQFERLSRAAGLAHAFSTRPRNLNARDAPAAVCEREQMARDLGLDSARIHYCAQAHGARIAIVPAAEAGRRSIDVAERSVDVCGRFGDVCEPSVGPDERSVHVGRRYERCDGVIADQPGAALMTFSADCPLILVFDPRRRAVGLAHAGWRGVVAGVTRTLVETMRVEFRCQPADLLAGIGPSAGPESYEVRTDVYEAAAGLPQRDALFPRRDGRMCFDLWAANRALLESAGVRPEAIELAGVCTMSEAELFYSFRRDGPGCAHFALIAGLLE
jgi:YfiH family protein